jgi:hypothetical protein
MTPIGFVLTFVAVATSMVIFRSSTMGAASNLLKGMIGLNGVALPQDLYDRLGPLAGWLRSMGVVAEAGSSQSFLMMTVWIPALMFIALVCPNTLQILARYEPALGVKPRPTDQSTGGMVVEWKASLPWAIGVSIIAAIGIFFLGRESQFLYWQF